MSYTLETAEDSMLAWLIAAVLLQQDAVTEGVARLNKGEFEAALEIFDAVLVRNPKNAAARLGRARAYEGLKRPSEETLKEYSRAIEDHPRSSEVYFLRGAFLYTLDRWIDALNDFDRALELEHPKPGIIWAHRGACFLRLHRFKEALRDLNGAVEDGFTLTQVYFWRARAHFMFLETRGAIADATRILDADPLNSVAWNVRWMSYYRIRAWENSLRDVRTYVKAVGKLSENDAFWMFLAASRVEPPEKAVETLREQWALREKTGPGAWRIVGYVLGESSEEELLRVTGDAPVAHVYLGYIKELRGDLEGALKHFERAARELKPDLLEWAEARLGVRSIKYNRKRTRVDAWEKQMRVLPPFEARFKVDGVEFAEGRAMNELVLSADLPGRKALFRAAGPPGEIQAFMLFEDMKGRFWGNWPGIRGKIDMGPFLSGFEDLDGLMRGGLEKIAPKKARPDASPESPPGFLLNLTVEGRESKEGQVRFRIASGRGSHPVSWLSEIMEADDATFLEEGDEVVVELPAARKRIRVDRETGFLREMEARDAEGGAVRRLRRESFRHLEAWPAVDVPADLELMPMDPAELRRLIEARPVALMNFLRDVMDCWEMVEAAQATAQVEGYVTRWVAQYVDGLHAFAVRRRAQAWIQQALVEGADVVAMRRDIDAHARRFAALFGANDGDHLGFVRNEILRLGARIETGVLGSWVDSRTHGPFRRLLRNAMDYEKVKATRQEVYGDRIEKLFREELEAFRRS